MTNGTVVRQLHLPCASLAQIFLSCPIAQKLHMRAQSYPCVQSMGLSNNNALELSEEDNCPAIPAEFWPPPIIHILHR